jgi:ribosomal protein S18 acetylase RimI-like enzyme
MKIRQAGATDTAVLWEMLTYAASMPASLEQNLVDARVDPTLQSYVLGFGRVGDLGVIAQEQTGEALGAAWLRLCEAEPVAHRHGSDREPELAIGVRAAHRRQGHGAALMRELLTLAAGRYPAIVLSVRVENPSIRLYRRFGFSTVREIENRVGGASLIMRRALPTKSA